MLKKWKTDSSRYERLAEVSWDTRYRSWYLVKNRNATSILRSRITEALFLHLWATLLWLPSTLWSRSCFVPVFRTITFLTYFSLPIYLAFPLRFSALLLSYAFVATPCWLLHFALRFVFNFAPVLATFASCSFVAFFTLASSSFFLTPFSRLYVFTSLVVAALPVAWSSIHFSTISPCRHLCGLTLSLQKVRLYWTCNRPYGQRRVTGGYNSTPTASRPDSRDSTTQGDFWIVPCKAAACRRAYDEPLEGNLEYFIGVADRIE